MTDNQGDRLSFRNEEDKKSVRGTDFPTNAIRFRLSIKVPFKLPLRQTAEMAVSLLRLKYLGWITEKPFTYSALQEIHQISAVIRSGEYSAERTDLAPAANASVLRSYCKPL